MSLTKITFTTSGVTYAADLNSVQDNTETWVETLDGQKTGSVIFTYNPDGTISGINTSAGMGNDGYTFSYAAGKVGSIIESRDGNTISNQLIYTNSQITELKRSVS